VQGPLIVAVEPDQQQAAELTALLERQFGAELVLAATTSGVLAKVGKRVPELVLTSALIPPKEEADLLTWLRKLGPAASHVQAVTIPTLVVAEQAAPRRGGGLSFSREKPLASAPDSCDPSVFADWISVYLDLASTSRAETHG
jgi:hypothetical protein